MDENKVALIGIVVENGDSVEKLNTILHSYGEYIIGRMGIPYQKRNVSIISVAVDAPQSIISALSGKLGMLPGISAKTVYSKLQDNKKIRDAFFHAWQYANKVLLLDRDGSSMFEKSHRVWHNMRFCRSK